MKAIVCADINWGIGKGTGMLFHIPADLKFFERRASDFRSYLQSVALRCLIKAVVFQQLKD